MFHRPRLRAATLTLLPDPVAGWTGAILYSTAVGLALKLFSSMCQQKLIGENLSHYVKGESTPFLDHARCSD